MYLRRLEINGFKSFATKTVLELEPGITAIVGPNGSGKSNLADAIRWALGEQSSRPLRLKKSEDLVFAGTDKQPRASLAEVGLLLDNNDGALPIDFTEVELSRLLYRSGESEYKLNRSKIRLNEVQQLLVSAGFGPNSYAVIGQGTIDSFILATPAERKLLFDEASGIRQYEIKREQALRKLDATAANLTRVRDILAELEPRLKALGRSVTAAKERQSLEADLHRQRAVLLTTAEVYYPAEIKRLEAEAVELQQLIKQQSSAVKNLELEREAATAAASSSSKQQQVWRDDLRQLEIERDQLSGDLSVKRAELQMLLETKPQSNDKVRRQNLEAEVKQISSRLQATAKNLAAAQTEETGAQKILEAIGREITVAQTKLSVLRREIDETSRHEFITHALAILKALARGLADGSADSEQTRLLVHKAGRLLSHASLGQAEALTAIKQAQTGLNSLMKQRETAHSSYTKVVIKVRSFELDSNHLQARLQEAQQSLQDLATASLTINTPDPQLVSRRQQELVKLEQRLAEVSLEVDELRTHLAGQSETNPSAQAIFTLASELETAKSNLAAAHGTLSDSLSAKSACQEQFKRFQRLGRDWFGKTAIVAEASSDPIDKLEQAVVLIESKLESHGDRDDEALQEYNEVEQRHGFLTSQLSDLSAAQTDLGRVITQLEGLIKTKFEAAFGQISTQFSHYFERLFGGGQAMLELRPDSAGVYGVEIKALPPGKRVESLAMLSGGERSLTGIALLAAILKVNPSPFVVMDEVDAALDEANSTRFADILAEIGQHSQLIVITHNRQTMQAAQVLFGVTMDQNHVSRLLSLRLETAHELAARE